MQTFRYSKNNRRDFVIPDKFRNILEESEREKNKKKKKIGVVLLLIEIAAVLTLVISSLVVVYKLYGYWTDAQYAQAKQSEVASKMTVKKTALTRETPEYPVYEGSEEHVASYPQIVDREKVMQLSLIYPDFVGWFYIEGTTISYPVVFTEEYNYYLRRNMDGETNLSGTLFFDERNDVNTLKGNCIIYGHAMQNGTMFGTLKNYGKKSYYDQHKMIYLYTPTEVIVYRIFSAYETTTRNDYIRTSFADEAEYFRFISKCKSDSAYDTGVKLSPESDILTLSTCHYYNYDDGRFVVHAVKVGSSPLT